MTISKTIVSANIPSIVPFPISVSSASRIREDDIRNTAQYVINNIDKYTAKTKAFAKTEFPLPYMMGINDTNGLEPTFAASEMLWMPISTVDISKISYAIC